MQMKRLTADGFGYFWWEIFYQVDLHPVFTTLTLKPLVKVANICFTIFFYFYFSKIKIRCYVNKTTTIYIGNYARGYVERLQSQTVNFLSNMYVCTRSKASSIVFLPRALPGIVIYTQIIHV